MVRAWVGRDPAGGSATRTVRKRIEWIPIPEERLNRPSIWTYPSIFLSILTLACTARCQLSVNEQTYILDAVRIDRDIDLTGRLSDPLWTLAHVVGCPFEVTPGENTPAKQPTEVRVLYNSRYLYVGFRCVDSNVAAVRAHVTDRDNNFQDDFVFVGIDPFRNNQRGYEFVVNPLGIQADLMRTANNEDASWDAVWFSKGALNDSGYTVEMAIPFASIRFPSEPTQDWSLMIVRNFPRDSRYQNSWTPTDRNNPCSICMSGTLRGLTGLEATSTVEVLPYAMGYQAGRLNDESDPSSGFSNDRVNGRVGIGAKYVPNSSLWFEGVLNPDFSQVESDATQISVNSPFAIFYPEKRPFFLDGADLFTTQMRQFYSRMINNPLVATKVASKTQHLTIAYIGAEDRNSAFFIPGDEGSYAVQTSEKSFSNIIRGRYDFGTRSFVGALVTGRSFSDAHNFAGSVDWNLSLGETYTLAGQAIIAQTKEINDTTLYDNVRHYGGTRFTKAFDGESYGGTNVTLELRRDARELSFDLSYQDCSPTFQAQNGFITENDFRLGHAEMSYAFYPNGEIVDYGYVFLQGILQSNYEGARKQRWSATGFNLQLKSQTNLNFEYFLYNEELFHDVRFNKINRFETQINSSPNSTIQLNADIAAGKFIYRGDTPTTGKGHTISLAVYLKPTPKIELDLSYARSRLSDAYNGNLLFDGYIARGVAIYQFSGDLFCRLIAQYDRFRSAIDIDPLVSYKLNPFTIFYVGSTHSLSDFGEPFGFRLSSRQYFLKLQYLWSASS